MGQNIWVTVLHVCLTHSFGNLLTTNICWGQILDASDFSDVTCHHNIGTFVCNLEALVTDFAKLKVWLRQFLLWKCYYCAISFFQHTVFHVLCLILFSNEIPTQKISICHVDVTEIWYEIRIAVISFFIGMDK